jgi:hypothetical protein
MVGDDIKELPQFMHLGGDLRRVPLLAAHPCFYFFAYVQVRASRALTDACNCTSASSTTALPLLHPSLATRSLLLCQSSPPPPTPPILIPCPLFSSVGFSNASALGFPLTWSMLESEKRNVQKQKRPSTRVTEVLSY